MSEKPQSSLVGEMLADYPPTSGEFSNTYLGLVIDRKEFIKDVLQLFPAGGEKCGQRIVQSPKRGAPMTLIDILTTITTKYPVGQLLSAGQNPGRRGVPGQTGRARSSERQAERV